MNTRKRRNKDGLVYEYFFMYHGLRYSQSGYPTKSKAAKAGEDKKAELIAREKAGLILETNKTLNEVYEEFMEIGSNRYQANTLYNTEKDWKYVKDNLGKMKIKDITYKVLESYFNERKEDGIEKNRGIKKSLSRVFTYALKCEYVQKNPTLLITVVGVENKLVKRILSDENFKLLTKALEEKDTFFKKAVSIAVQIGYYTGARVSEIACLNKDDCDLERGFIHFEKKLVYKGLQKKDFYATSQMKSKKSHGTVPIPQVLVEALKIWFKENPFDRVVCDEDGYYLNPDSMGNQAGAIAKQLGFHYNFHMLRHTYATKLIEGNVDIKIAQELLRHANFNTTLTIYTHINEQKKMDAIRNVF